MYFFGMQSVAMFLEENIKKPIVRELINSRAIGLIERSKFILNTYYYTVSKVWFDGFLNLYRALE